MMVVQLHHSPPSLSSSKICRISRHCTGRPPALRSRAFMTGKHVQQALKTAVAAAQSAGTIMRANLRLNKKINKATQHDIKLELDVRCQKTIERRLRKDFAEIAIL